MVHRLPVRLPRLTLVIGLLVVALGVASALAWQAHRVAQSHHAAAEKVLNDYVAFAGWEFSRAARRELESSLDRWLAVITCAASSGPLPAPEALVTRNGCKSETLQAKSLFVLDLATGRFHETGEPLSETLRGWIRTAADSTPPTQVGHPRAVRIEAAEGGAVAMAGRVVRERGTAVSFAGFISDAAAFAPGLAKVVKQSPLLPPTLAGSGNEMLAVAVTTSGGFPVYASGPMPSGAAARGLLDENVGGFAYQIALRPEAAGRLVIGGLPRSRLPLLLGLLGLTAGLLIVAVQQLRREHELARMRADFVSSVSHELRTPLAQIRLFSDTLLLGRVRSEAEGRRSLEIINQESRRLAHLVENVLYFSRGERGAQQIAPVPTRLAALVSEVVETFAPLASARSATIRVAVRDDVHAPLDPGAVRQIVLNLLDNAVKYGPPGQSIAVTVDRIGTQALLTVEDQGPGIPVEARERIWSPYARLAAAATSAIAGTGIGLAVVRELSDLHGGTSRVEDAERGGARFVVLFPGAEPPSQHQGAAAQDRSVPA